MDHNYKKYIVVIIPKFNFYQILFEEDFLDGNEFRTQNTIIEVLDLMGIPRDSYTCDLCYK